MIHPAALLAMIVFVSAVTGALGASGCYQKNSAYDQDARACEGPSECGGDICDDGVCVQCTPQDDSRCTGNNPICAANGKCQPCSSHEQCNEVAGVCTPQGACAMASEVAYVSSTGTENADCSKATPCKVSGALATLRPYVLFEGTVTENVRVSNRKNIAFLALPNAKLKSAAIGAPVLTLENNGELTIVDLEITEGAGAAGHGIAVSGNDSVITLRNVRLFKNGGAGLYATDGTVDIMQSTIVDNIGAGVVSENGNAKISRSLFTDNDEGGLSVRSGTFEVINNIFFRNGSATSSRGGVSFDNITTTGNKFEFNTVVRNRGAMTILTGVQCSAVTMPLPMSNSIIYGNTQDNVTGDTDQVGGSSNCTWAYSLIGPKALPPGSTGVLSADPQFTGVEDFQLKSTSPALNAADMAATVNVDFYGKPRPAPVGGRADMGAIETQ